MSKTDDLIQRADYGQIVADGRKKQPKEDCPACYEDDPGYPCCLKKGHAGHHSLGVLFQPEKKDNQ